MKKNIDIDEFKDIMLGKKIQQNIENYKKTKIIKEKKNIVNTTFEEPKEIKNTNYKKNTNINLNDFADIMLGNKSEKQENIKVKKKIINTTFEEPKEIKGNIFKNNNFTIEEFENLMLGVSKDKKIKKSSTNKNTKIIEKIPVIKSILIDGSNVLRTMYTMKAEKDKNYKTEDNLLIKFLYEYLKQYIIESYDKISLYLDGNKRKINVSVHPHIQLEFSKTKPADNLIVNDLLITVEQQPNIRKEVILITNDKELISRCKDIFKDITVMSSDNFLRYLGHSNNFKFLNETI